MAMLTLHFTQGLSMEAYDIFRTSLKPGETLDDMNRLMIQSIAKSLDSLTSEQSPSTRIHLFQWVRDRVTAATTNAVYGPQNPFKEKEVVDAFW